MNKIKNLIIIILLFVSTNIYSQNNPCVNYNNYKIVVLGSSTAAGAGVSSADSAWVNRYINYLQTINPNNEVINLAVGGYNTYKIMPTNYSPPIGRPYSDTSRNITAAINHSPDAIIINLPSNDIAQGFSVNEQLFNFDTIVQISENNNIPIWVCTTQPKNFSDPLLRQLQEDVKDSIELLFYPHTIDFWSFCATTDNYIDSIYDSGDGTHLNDAAHNILNQQVINTGILDTIYVPSVIVDYELLDIKRNQQNACGDINDNFSVIFANIGAQDSTSIKVNFEFKELNTNVTILDSFIVNSTNPCSTDTISFVGNTYIQGDYKVKCYLSNINDTINYNDTLEYLFNTSGHPNLVLLGDTFCNGGNATYTAIHDFGDTVYWYHNPADTIPVAYGNQFISSYINTNDTMYAESIRGDLFYKDNVFTSSTSNINWNGTMFDIVAHQDIIIDNFDVKIYSTGWQGVKIYYKSGSYISFEQNQAAWTLLDTAYVFVDTLNIFANVPIGNLSINTNDTVGIYISMINSNASLSYQSIANTKIRQNQEISMITGSGISYNFSNSYFARDWSGRINYHFGYKPFGDCSSGKIMVKSEVGNNLIDLGNDTIIDISDTLVLTAPTGMNYYEWNNGLNDSVINILGANLGIGSHLVTLEVIDNLQCNFTDSVIITVADLNTIDNNITDNKVNIYPNPTKGNIFIDKNDVVRLELFTLDNKKLMINNNSNNMFIGDLKDGFYILKIYFKDIIVEKKIMKISN